MPLLLESFDAPIQEPPPAGPSADWLEGHAAGFAEGLAQGRAEAEERSTHLSRDLAQSLQDTAFSYAEARGQVLLALRPLFALLAARLLPSMAAEALGPWILERLLEAAEADTACPLRIEVHPSRLEAVRTCLPAGHPAILCGDASLGPGAARLSAGGGESELDLDACLAVLREALLALLDDQALRVRHG